MSNARTDCRLKLGFLKETYRRQVVNPRHQHRKVIQLQTRNTRGDYICISLHHVKPLKKDKK